MIAQHLNERDGLPSEAAIQKKFSKAQPGDVVQMYWDYGNITQHTFIISYRDDNCLQVLQSNVNNGIPDIRNSEYTWGELAKYYSESVGNAGGFTIYRFSSSGTPEPTPLPEGAVRIDETNFPDKAFRSYVFEECDTNRDGILSAEEIACVTSMTVGQSRETGWSRITDLKGIEYFTALTYLRYTDNRLTALDVSHNTALTYLDCGFNQLTALDVSHNSALTYLDCSDNQLTTLDLSNNTALTRLECCGNQLTTLDVSNCPESIRIHCDDGVTIIRDNKDKPSITTTSLKVGTIGKSYSVTLKGTGTKPLKWKAEGLPSGLNCSEKGKISGKPTAFGTFNVKFTLSNGAGNATKELQLTIKGIPPKLSSPLAKGELGVAYSSGLKLTKGSTPLTWSIEGTLPEGLSFNTSRGVISGAPMSYKSSGFKVKITASNGAGDKSKSVKLKVKGTKPKITTTSLPNATLGQPYSAKLTATGSEPIEWDATNLPEGLTLNGDTISGTPTGAAKSYKVKLTATNPVKSAKKTVILKVIAASDTRLPAMSESVGDSYSFVEHSVLPELTLANSDGYIIVAVLPEISVDVSGMYEFDVALSDDVPEGAELVYLANSDSPSDDDEISEFFDAEGEPITTVPEDRRITLSIWLNPHTVCNPAIAIKQ